MTSLADHALAIQNVKAGYCAAADLSASDPAKAKLLMADIFTEDFVGDYGFDPLKGANAIIDFLCFAISSKSEWVLHALHSPRIEVSGDRATGDWTVVAHMKRKEGGAIDTVMGRYSDTFRLTPNGWRLAEVKFSRLQ